MMASPENDTNPGAASGIPTSHDERQGGEPVSRATSPAGERALVVRLVAEGIVSEPQCR